MASGGDTTAATTGGTTVAIAVRIDATVDSEPALPACARPVLAKFVVKCRREQLEVERLAANSWLDPRVASTSEVAVPIRCWKPV